MPEIVVAERQVRRELGDAPERRLGFGQLAELPLNHADVVHRLMTGRIAGRRALERAQGSVGAIELAERGSEVGPRRSEVRHQIRRPLKRRRGLLHVVAPQPQLAALEVRGGPVGREGDGFIEIARSGIEIVHLHARAGGRDESRRRASGVERADAGREARGGIVKTERRGKSFGGRVLAGGERGLAPRSVTTRRQPMAAGVVHERPLKGTAAGADFRRMFEDRRAIRGCQEQHVAAVESIEPCLHQVRRLRGDESRAAALTVEERLVNIGHPHDGRGVTAGLGHQRMREWPEACGRGDHRDRVGTDLGPLIGDVSRGATRFAGFLGNHEGEA